MSTNAEPTQATDPARQEVAIRILEAPRAKLGECPLYDPRTKRLYWIDCTKSSVLYGTLHEDGLSFVQGISPGQGRSGLVEHAVPQQQVIGSVGLTQDPDILLCSFGLAFHTLDVRDGTWTERQRVLPSGDPYHINDGKVDRSGRWWAGLVSHHAPHDAGLYSWSGRGGSSDSSSSPPRRWQGGLHIANGLDWSLDNRTMYHTDSGKRTIYRYQYDHGAGSICNRQTLVTTSADDDQANGVPDGLCIDNEGHLWCAQWDGWCIVRYHGQTGERLQVIKMPAQRPTSCCWGGSNLDILYVTSASQDLGEEQPLPGAHDGNLFAITGLGHKGLTPSYFTGQFT